MKKMMKKLVALGLVAMTMGATVTAVPLQAASVSSMRSVQDIKPNQTTVNYSDMVKGDGAVYIRFNLPEGVKLTTNNPSEFSDNLTQNYDISISEMTPRSRDYFEINVNWSNPGIQYNGDWVININGSMFTDGKDRTVTVGVFNDLSIGTPRITTNVDKGVTVRQLTQGFDLVMNIENARFNTACFGNYIRVSMMNSCGIKGLYPVAYCDSLRPNQVKMRVQAPNGVESWRTHFEFKIEGNATNSSIPITVRIPIVR